MNSKIPINPKLKKTCWKNKFAAPSAVTIFLQGIINAVLLKRSNHPENPSKYSPKVYSELVMVYTSPTSGYSAYLYNRLHNPSQTVLSPESYQAITHSAVNLPTSSWPQNALHLKKYELHELKWVKAVLKQETIFQVIPILEIFLYALILVHIKGNWFTCVTIAAIFRGGLNRKSAYTLSPTWIVADSPTIWNT